MLACSQLAQAQHGQLGFYFATDTPEREIMQKMSTSFSFGVSGAYSPFRTARVFAEFKASWGIYSSETLEQTYTFGNGFATNTNVHYNSYVSKYLLGTKVMLNRDYRIVRAYATPQFGLANMRTRIVIDDPLDEDGCEVLDRSTRHRSTGFVYGGEVGVELPLERIFRKDESESKHKLVLSFSVLTGIKPFEYVNVKYMEDHVHSEMVTHESNDINATFINLTTNDIHEHKVAELYTTRFLTYGINVGYIFSF